MANTVCGRCGHASYMAKIGNTVDVYDGYNENMEKLHETAHTCANCQRISILSVHYENFGSGDYPYESYWTPSHGEVRDFSDVPDHIASAATEAVACHNSRAYRASGALARAVVEATAKEKKVTKGDLWQKIEKMRELGLIREHIKEAAHEVRHFGNGMAHGDFVDPVTEEEASEALALMAEVLNEVYQSPARVARVRTGRLAKNAVAGGTEPLALPEADASSD